MAQRTYPLFASRPRWLAEVLTVLLLVAAAAGLMRDHLSGHSLFLGNYDRLGYFLPARLTELDAVRSHGVPDDWNEKMFMGFNAADLPGASTPFSPMRLVTAFGARGDFYYWAGVCVASLLALAGSAMYVCLRQLALGRIASFAGAIIYMGSTHTMIRLAQSDTAGLLLVALPTGAWLVFGATPDRASRRLVALALIIALIFLSATGPLTIYALGLWGCLALFQAWRTRQAAPFWVFTGGLLSGLLIATPHLWGVAADLGNYARDGGIGHSFDEVYDFFNVRPYEFLRMFDDGIFGHDPAEVARLGNNLNLNEGFQIYSGTFATLCMIAVMLRFRGEWFRLFKFRDGLFSFFAWLMLAVGAAILIKPAAEAVFVLFMKAKLLHARLSFLGTLAVSILAALGIQQYVELNERNRARAWSAPLAAIAAGLLWFALHSVTLSSLTPTKLDLRRPLGENLATSLQMFLPHDSPLLAPSAVRADRIAPRTIQLRWHHTGRPAETFEISMGRGDQPLTVIGSTSSRYYDIGDTAPDAVYRFSLRARTPALISPPSPPVQAEPYDASSFPATDQKRVLPSVWLLSNRLLAVALSLALFGALAVLRIRSGPWAAGSAQVLILLALIQVVCEADKRWNGEQNRTYPKPFASDNLFIAPAGVLGSTNHAWAEDMRVRLDPDKYRTVFVAPPEQFTHFVSPHLASYWRLRTVEGYLSGVPSRLAALPWGQGNVGFRHISFVSSTQLPWDLLGRLNVRQAIVVDPRLYFDAETNSDRLAAGSLQIIPNPAPVLPREFFAARGIPAPAFSASAKVPFEILREAPATVAVEGLPAERRWHSGGTIDAKYQGGHISIKLDPSSHPRFLVLNELYHPRWFARTGQTSLKLYAVNTVMRGIEVPAGVTALELEFRPYSRFPGWWLFPVTGLSLLLATMVRTRRESSSSGKNKPIPPGHLWYQKFSKRLRDPQIQRWLGVGLAATGLNLGLLYLLVDVLGVPFFLAPLASAEICLTLRFLANDRWVFGHPRPTWRRLGAYHIAVAGGFVLWWATSNILVFFGVHYLLAALLAIVGSIGFNLATNFAWIWKKRSASE